MKGENLRKDQRIAAQIAVVFKRGRSTWSQATSDVSFRGLFVVTTSPPPLRSLVQMRVTLPSHTFETHAMVVHVKASEDGGAAGVGLQFWGFSGPDRLQWDAFVRRLLVEKSLEKPPARTRIPSAQGLPRLEDEIPADTSSLSGVRRSPSVTNETGGDASQGSDRDSGGEFGELSFFAQGRERR